MGCCDLVRCSIGFLVTITVVTCLYEGDSCFTENKNGLCTQLSRCPYLMQEIKGAGSPMPGHIKRKLHALMCGFHFDEPIVCCVTLNIIPLNRPDNDNADPYKEDKTEVGDLNKAKVPSDVTRHRNLQLLPTNCGTWESDRLFGGNQTKLYEQPWMVLIAYDSKRGRKLSCGGTIINEWYVLTAAHCVKFLGGLTLSGVVLGEYDTDNDPDCETIEDTVQCAPVVQTVNIQKVTAHPGYNPQNLTDDIALIRLATPADFTLENMKPICLPTTADLMNENLIGSKSEVAGWGAKEDGLQSSVLLHVDLPVLSNKVCETAYKTKLRDSQLCAGGVQNKDSCAGDSGGPLMFPGKVGSYGVRYVQRGIVSYGSKRCGIGGFPGIYTNVAYYMDWILNNMEE